MYLKTKTYDNENEFLASDKYVAFTATLTNSGVTADSEGKKYVPKGTLVDADGNVVTVSKTAGTKGVFTLTIGTAFEADEEVTINGATYKAAIAPSAADEFAVGSSASDQAVALKALLVSDDFTITNSGATIVFTQKLEGVGTIPTVSESATTGAASIAQTTAGVASTLTASATPKGILFNTEDVTYGNQPVSLVVEGYVIAERLQGDNVPEYVHSSAFKTALPKITVM